MESFEEYFARMTRRFAHPGLDGLVHPLDDSHGSRQKTSTELPEEKPEQEAHVILTVSCSTEEEDFNPTVGDVEHFIETLGFGPGVFRIRLMAESQEGAIRSTAFLLSGLREFVQKLRSTHRNR